LAKLGRAYFRQPAEKLAEDLIGRILVRRLGAKRLRARLVETEAYLGPVDLASHASKGKTRRTEVMFGRAGHAYVYLIYGMYDMLNIVAGPPESAHAVLLRAAEPLDGWEADLSGPGKLARGFKVTRAQNGLDLTGRELYLWPGSGAKPRIVRTARIGVDYAQHWKDELLRFCDADSRAVSRPPRARPRVTYYSGRG
jgi:DNA-3-methyladenine glycosylase